MTPADAVFAVMVGVAIALLLAAITMMRVRDMLTQAKSERKLAELYLVSAKHTRNEAAAMRRQAYDVLDKARRSSS